MSRPDIELEILATGLAGSEGPVVLADGDVRVVEVLRGALAIVSPSGAVEGLAQLVGGPNGAAIGPGGWIFAANNRVLAGHTLEGVTDRWPRADLALASQEVAPASNAEAAGDGRP